MNDQKIIPIHGWWNAPKILNGIPVLFQNLQKKGDEMHHLELKK